MAGAAYGDRQMKLAVAVAALFVFAFPATASAEDELPTCSEGYVAYMSAGGPRCGNPIYLDGTWNDDPHDCVHGYYQGSCAPEPQPPPVLPVEAYLFQMDNPSPEYVADVVVKLGKLDRLRMALLTLR